MTLPYHQPGNELDVKVVLEGLWHRDVVTQRRRGLQADVPYKV
jgi:hypothetical protein